MPEHLTPILLTVAFASIWAIVALIYIADSLREVRKRRPAGRHGPHFLNREKDHRSPRKVTGTTN